MITMTADFTVAEKDMAAAEALLAKLAAAVSSEPGNVRYDILRITQPSRMLRVYEVYESEEAFEAHKSSDHLRAIFPEFRKLLTAAPVLTRYEFVASA